MQDPLNQTLISLISFLEHNNIDYFVTGGVAVSRYTTPRFTQDIDIVLNLKITKDRLPDFINKLPKDFEAETYSCEQSLKSHKTIQIYDVNTGFKIDFYFSGNTEGCFERAIKKEIVPGAFAKIISLTDLIISKLIWIQHGSFKSIQDAHNLLKELSETEKALLLNEVNNLSLHLEYKKAERGEIPL